VELEMSGEKDLELNLRSSRRKEFSDMSGHSTSSRTPSVLKKEKKKCFEKPENQKEKTEEIEKKQKGPKTGPLPASSMPMMQGLDAHSGRGGSDPSLSLSLSLSRSPRSQSLSKEIFSTSRHKSSLRFRYWICVFGFWAFGGSFLVKFYERNLSPHQKSEMLNRK
jgi:hypothetical protein